MSVHLSQRRRRFLERLYILQGRLLRQRRRIEVLQRFKKL